MGGRAAGPGAAARRARRSRRARAGRPAAARGAGARLRDPGAAALAGGGLARCGRPAGRDRAGVRRRRGPGGRARRGAAPELELELVRGDAGALFGLAEALRRWSRSGSSRGTRRRAAGCSRPARRRPSARRSPWNSTPGRTVGDALGRILSARSATGSTTSPRPWPAGSPRASTDAGGAAPPALRPQAVRGRPDAGRARAVDGELRWLLGTLGPARDLDVLTGDLLPPLLEACPRGRRAPGVP